MQIVLERLFQRLPAWFDVQWMILKRPRFNHWIGCLQTPHKITKCTKRVSLY